MAKDKSESEINLLKRALKIAAIEAYQNEIVDTEMFSLTIGGDKRFHSVKDWLERRMDTWLKEAELKT